MTGFNERMAELRLRFEGRADSELHRLIQAIDRRDAAEIVAISHRLAGNAGVFGFHRLGDAAREVEEALERGAPPAELERSCGILVSRLRALGASSPP